MADEALDVAVFSLSVMGKNWSEYISLVKATKTTLMQNENHFYTKKLLKIIILNSREMTCSIKAQLTDKMRYLSINIQLEVIYSYSWYIVAHLDDQLLNTKTNNELVMAAASTYATC